MGMDTQALEQASETNKKIIDAINPEERLFAPTNDVQEAAMEVEPYLELLAGLAAVTKRAVKFVGRGEKSGKDHEKYVFCAVKVVFLA